MPPEARVAIFEDDPRFVRRYRRILGDSGHTVVVVASTIGKAQTVLETLGRRKVQVVIVDGNLTPGDISGEDGRKVNARIKQLFPGIITIGISGSKVKGADLSLAKDGSQGLQKLGRLVTNA